MEFIPSKRLPLLILLAITLFNAIAIWPDLRMGDLSNGDTVSHLELIRGMTDALEHGRNPLDFWSPWSAFGYPEIRTYQPLAHALVVLVYFALGKSVSIVTVFSWVQYLMIVLLPASFFAAAALIGLSPLTA